MDRGLARLATRGNTTAMVITERRPNDMIYVQESRIYSMYFTTEISLNVIDDCSSALDVLKQRPCK